MKKLLLIIISLASLALLSTSCSRSQKCICDNWSEGTILNSFTTTPEEYGVSDCADIGYCNYYFGKSGLDCYDK